MSTLTSLVAVLGAPVAWTFHLLGSYVLVGLACAAGRGGAAAGLVLVTGVCLAASLASGLIAYRRWRAAGRKEAGEADVVFVGVLGAPVFALAIAFEAVVAVFLPLCPVVR